MTINTILLICLTISIVAFTIFGVLLISVIGNYFTAKRSLVVAQAAELVKKESFNGSALDIGERIDYTIDLLNLTNTLIDVEINGIIRSHQRLNQRYESMNLDEDMKKIANKVFSGIKPDIIQSEDLVIDTEFILQHIADETILRLIYATYEYNNQLQNL